MVLQKHQRLHELGDFLRTRRARLTPEDVGFPRGSRRRAPGLTRKAHGYEPKKAKGLSQSLAAHGLDVSVLGWVYINPGSRTKARGVNGLKILQCDNKLSTVSLEMGTNGNR